MHKDSDVATTGSVIVNRNNGANMVVVNINRSGELIARVVHIIKRPERETGECQGWRPNRQRTIRLGIGGMLLTSVINTQGCC